jgi:hypothetical protein
MLQKIAQIILLSMLTVLLPCGAEGSLATSGDVKYAAAYVVYPNDQISRV